MSTKLLGLLPLLGLLAGPAQACPPSPFDSEAPCGITLVGTTNGVPDPRGEFTIIIRGLSRDPIEGSSVVIDLGACASDVHVSTVYAVAGSSTNCTNGYIYAVTNAQGVVTLRVAGAATHTGPAGTTYGCAKVYADGVFLGDMNISAFDQNASGGVGPVDISEWLSDAFSASGTYMARSDFDCSRTVGPPDLSMLVQASLGGGSSTSSGSYCR
jgi:hypothetical protein